MEKDKPGKLNDFKTPPFAKTDNRNMLSIMHTYAFDLKYSYISYIHFSFIET